MHRSQGERKIEGRRQEKRGQRVEEGGQRRGGGAEEGKGVRQPGDKIYEEQVGKGLET